MIMVQSSLRNLEKKLLKDRLLKVFKSSWLDRDMAGASDHVIAIVHFQPLGRLRWYDAFWRFDDDRQAIDSDTTCHQEVARNSQSLNLLATVFSVARDIDDLSAALKRNVKLCISIGEGLRDEGRTT
jgi:hypothetical protein